MADRHEVQCDHCEQWVPMARGHAGCGEPPGWLRLSISLHDGFFDDFNLCSFGCLTSHAIRRLIEQAARSNGDGNGDAV